jgi:hypothetical protein
VSAGAIGPAPPFVVQCNQWLHIGLQELKPIVFEGHRLEPRTSSDTIDIVEPCGEVTLVGQWQFESTWTFVRDLCKTHVWYMRFFRISSSGRPLGYLRPIQCIVNELEPLTGVNLAVRFWNGQTDIDLAKRTEERRLTREASKAAEAGTGQLS